MELKLFSFCLAFALIPSAQAVTATSTFQVTMTIVKSCTVTSGTNINFGNVNSNVANSAQNTNFSVTCSRLTPYFIGLAPSAANGGNTTGAGSMASTLNAVTNTDKVPYQLYQNATNTIVWGNTATATTVGNGVAGVGTGLAQPYTAYAVVPSANFSADTYADTVTINVNY